MSSQVYSDEEIRERRRQRILEAKRRKRRRKIINRCIRIFAPPVAGAVVLFLLIFTGINLLQSTNEAKAGQESIQETGKGNEAGHGVNGGDGSSVGEGGMIDPGAVGGGEDGNGDSTSLGSLGNGSAGGIVGGNVGNGGQEGADGGNAGNGGTEGANSGSMENGTLGGPDNSAPKVYSARTTEDTKGLGEDIISSHAILIDLDSDSILAQKDAMSRMNPASMTKILTVLVAAEHVTNLDDTFTITLDITDYSFVNDCSCVGFARDETVTIRDLFYGTILPSGADAAAALATYVAGSKEAFVDMMNDKLRELGLSDTAHMTNCVGLYDENHYCTAYDMAMILEAALDNELCREVMSAHTYTTSATEQHPEGITVSNWFLRRIEDKDTGGEVVCAKTGYVIQSGNCAASYAVDGNGKRFVCVTANANSAWRCIYDHVALYKQFSTVQG